MNSSPQEKLRSLFLQRIYKLQASVNTANHTASLENDLLKADEMLSAV